MCQLKLWVSFRLAGEGSLSNAEDIITPGRLSAPKLLACLISNSEETNQTNK